MRRCSAIEDVCWHLNNNLKVFLIVKYSDLSTLDQNSSEITFYQVRVSEPSSFEPDQQAALDSFRGAGESSVCSHGGGGASSRHYCKYQKSFIFFTRTDQSGLLEWCHNRNRRQEAECEACSQKPFDLFNRNVPVPKHMKRGGNNNKKKHFLHFLSLSQLNVCRPLPGMFFFLLFF